MAPEFLANVPEDDEELTPEMLATLERASSSITRGETISHEDILREFGADPLLASNQRHDR